MAAGGGAHVFRKQLALRSVCVCVSPELHTEAWAPPPREGAEEAAGRQQTGGAAREDDSDTELTYGEVEQRLDLLQQHLNR